MRVPSKAFKHKCHRSWPLLPQCLYVSQLPSPPGAHKGCQRVKVLSTQKSGVSEDSRPDARNSQAAPSAFARARWMPSMLHMTCLKDSGRPMHLRCCRASCSRASAKSTGLSLDPTCSARGQKAQLSLSDSETRNY